MAVDGGGWWWMVAVGGGWWWMVVVVVVVVVVVLLKVMIVFATVVAILAVLATLVVLFLLLISFSLSLSLFSLSPSPPLPLHFLFLGDTRGGCPLYITVQHRMVCCRRSFGCQLPRQGQMKSTKPYHTAGRFLSRPMHLCLLLPTLQCQGAENVRPRICIDAFQLLHQGSWRYGPGTPGFSLSTELMLINAYYRLISSESFHTES